MFCDPILTRETRDVLSEDKRQGNHITIIVVIYRYDRVYIGFLLCSDVVGSEWKVLEPDSFSLVFLPKLVFLLRDPSTRPEEKRFLTSLSL